MARIRGHKIEVGARTFRIYRGDMHRHTDISPDGVGDGSLLDLHRYALDAAALDFIVVTDHNMGADREYPWWRTQKANDLYTVPHAFISMYGYERSVPYPNGHRNVIWTERGHRTLPLPRAGIRKQMAEDTCKLYDDLRRSGGICTPHTSATEQGTNWAEHDDALEPVVELFQGFDSSYESPGAPRTIDDKSDRVHGPYKPDGFVSLALAKGYRLGFQSSSDHVSTHISYTCILAEEFSRKGLIEALEETTQLRRHGQYRARRAHGHEHHGRRGPHRQTFAGRGRARHRPARPRGSAARRRGGSHAPGGQGKRRGASTGTIRPRRSKRKRVTIMCGWCRRTHKWRGHRRSG